ncbi:FMN-binding negative transcriptional regulator [Roseateles sp. BYS180W]|uniref:FMN-binding negative transcriptional regulator n=1 Tax=Roseateles rivi TaxID=3299028 RepID=A0ABW7FY48_9BURK
MYCPAHFQQNDPDALLALMHQHPLATVVRHSAGGVFEADHIPVMHQAVAGTLGCLRGHVAKANPLWQSATEQELLLVFQGPSAYITPSWYESKTANGKVVPTWNYAVVHAHCTLRAVHEPQALRQLVSDLSQRHEAGLPHPWRLDEAPPAYIDTMLQHIVGVEFTIHRLQGKFKVGQNQPEQNQRSLVQALEGQGSDAHQGLAALLQAHRRGP